MRRKKRRNARRASNKRKSDGERRERERERERKINSQLSRRPVQTPWGRWPCSGDSAAVVCEC